MSIVQVRGLEVWLDGQRVALIEPGLSETMKDRVRAAFDGVEIEAFQDRLKHVCFGRVEGDA